MATKINHIGEIRRSKSLQKTKPKQERLEVTEFLYRREDKNLLYCGLLFENQVLKTLKTIKAAQTVQVLGPGVVRACVMCEVGA